MEKKNFGGQAHKEQVYGLVLLIFLLVSIISITLAYLFVDDFSTNYVGLSGKVDIIAVGKGSSYNSIEDGVDTTNLEIVLDGGNYDVLIPGMPIEAMANVKVFKSTTKPLIRAKFSVELYHMVDGNPIAIAPSDDPLNLQQNFIGQLDKVIEGATGWYQFTDGYYYYIGNNPIDTANPENTQMREVDATNNDTYVDFINAPIKFPEEIDTRYETMGVKFKITFEAIQNFIPNKDTGEEYFHTKGDGTKVNNTIKFSKYIFDDPEDETIQQGGG